MAELQRNLVFLSILSTMLKKSLTRATGRSLNKIINAINVTYTSGTVIMFGYRLICSSAEGTIITVNMIKGTN